MRQLCLMFLFCFISGTVLGQHSSTAPIFDLVGPDLGDLHPEEDFSVLRRRERRIEYSFRTSGLDFNTPHTVWVVAFNNPQFCLSTPCSFADFPFVPGHDPRAMATFVNAGGGVSNGTDGYFVGTVDKTRKGASSTEVVLGPGLLNPKTADIRLVIRSHGEPGSFEDLLAALKSYRGACNADNAVQPFPCRDYQISIHLP